MAQVTIGTSYTDVEASEWDALVGQGSPFLEHAYLAGLEQLDCAVAETGWTPRPVLVRHEGRLVAAAPGWVKTHSMGEFVYDHGWADAAQRAGLRYYPKLVIGVPFTPVTGQRLLVAPGLDETHWRRVLLAGLEAAMEDAEGLHILFDTESESASLADFGLFRRSQYQFHWVNRGYGSFDDYLGALRSKTRKMIKRERRAVSGLDIRVVQRPSAEAMVRMQGFYANTCSQFGPWGRVYLSPEFFVHLGESWGERVVLIEAARDGEVVGATFNVLKGDRLYGRLWGASAEIDCLHFECCYYKTVEFAIEQQLAVFEPGHGGGHKYRRGFEPTMTWSNHALRHRGLHQALEQHCEREVERVAAQVAHLADSSPYTSS